MSEQKVDEEIDWAYKAIGAVIDGGKKAVAEPRLRKQFFYELEMKFPDWIEAILTLVKEEHRGVVVELVKTVVACLRSPSATK